MISECESPLKKRNARHPPAPFCLVPEKNMRGDGSFWNLCMSDPPRRACLISSHPPNPRHFGCVDNSRHLVWERRGKKEKKKIHQVIWCSIDRELGIRGLNSEGARRKKEERKILNEWGARGKSKQANKQTSKQAKIQTLESNQEKKTLPSACRSPFCAVPIEFETNFVFYVCNPTPRAPTIREGWIEARSRNWKCCPLD